MTLADLDGNGTLDLIAPIGSAEAHAIDRGVPVSSARLHWPMFRHDPARTGRYERPVHCEGDLDADGMIGFADL